MAVNLSMDSPKGWSTGFCLMSGQSCGVGPTASLHVSNDAHLPDTITAELRLPLGNE